MRRTFLFVSLQLVIALPLCPAYAQQRGRTPPRARQPSAAQTRDAATERRAQAVELLLETANNARLLDDLYYRARIQMLAADALWSADGVRARVIFRRAWEAAEAADKAEQEAAENELVMARDSVETVTEARDEVLSKVAARDASLAEIFLRELLDDKESRKNATRKESERRTPWGELSATGARRLALAYELLNKGDYSRAAQMLAPVILEGASGDTMAFILRLRERSHTDADALYQRLLEQTKRDAGADANTLLLLSAPLISPELLVVVDERGSLQFRPVPRAVTHANATPGVSPYARKLFYDLAVRALLRQFVPRSSSGGANRAQEGFARYFALGRLLPLFESATPDYAQYAPELRARLNALANDLEASRRDPLSNQFELDRLTPRNSYDPLAPQQSRLARASDKWERDRARLSFVQQAAKRTLWDRAQRTAYEIEDPGLRRVALSFIAINQIADISRAYADDKEDDFESVARFVSAAEVPPLVKAWGFAQAALIAMRKGDPARVRELLDEAERWAARVENGTRARVAAYTVVASTASRFDVERAWALLGEVVKAANGVEDLAGDELSLDILADESLSEDEAAELSIASEAFRLERIFEKMAHLDFNKALASARLLERDVPRAFALLSVARAQLEPLRDEEIRTDRRQKQETGGRKID
jgi:hypothetical protein